MKHIEKGTSLKRLPGDFIRDLTPENASAGLVAGVFGLSAGVIHISAGTAAGLDSSFIMIWVISYLMINGLFGLLVPSYYRLPLPMANSIPGALLFAAVIPVVGLEAALGATLIAGAISLVAGLTGVMATVMRLIPMPIVMGMIAGVLLSFGTRMVGSLDDALLPAAIMILSFFLAARLFRRVPPLLVAMGAGIAYLMATGVDFSGIQATVRFPEFVVPEFTLGAFLAYGLPLAIILVGMETPAGVGLVKGMGYDKVPANGITAVGGLGTMISSFFNLHSTCIAAPMTGICSSPEAGERDKRWVAAVITGAIFVVCAPFYGYVVSLIEATPGYFIAIIAGLALVRVLTSALAIAFSGKKHEMGALFAFLIAASGIQILGIGASFWALVLGVLISMIFETKDFEFIVKRETAAAR
ncbi:benzoate transporter [Halomonas daqingensis]|uniref:Benzoate transporter n=1 Tax=Billgrantia desiderata TaxID=52021 RepID=A0AAW4YXC0_9GAMM|nr:benzoate/H(+) symporter BenE family transporter [Halomonas desiderata]MCE8012399.1 benzoate transporter [Halomonas desiderata]MCE8031079.1 benzoate transporter [Halomonas desiderata]MCE8044720.1 benzoate transporter [Halomonas desiderata]MCE8049294.1 benzoate transporter [Halomonas desiderata]MCE8052815.1 benzoate transporter [Halomonas desiderata]